MKSHKYLAVSALLFSLSVAAIDEDEQFKQPINVDSKHQSMDGINNVALFQEDVIVTQGGMTIKADELKVIKRGGPGSELFVATGSPAFYKQDFKDGKKVTASANYISYDFSLKTIILDGNAELNQGGSLVRGEKIEYNIQEQRLAADSDENSDKRVRTIFLPEKKGDEK